MKSYMILKNKNFYLFFHTLHVLLTENQLTEFKGKVSDLIPLANHEKESTFDDL